MFLNKQNVSLKVQLHLSIDFNSTKISLRSNPGISGANTFLVGSRNAEVRHKTKQKGRFMLNFGRLVTGFLKLHSMAKILQGQA